MQHVHFQARVGVFNCQQILAKISFVIFDIVIKKTNRMWFSVVQVKFHWFGINWHVFNQSEYRNFCLYIIIQKIAPQAKCGKYYQIWFFPRFGGKNGGVLSMRMQVILDSSFARPGSAPIWGGEERIVQGLDYSILRLETSICWISKLWRCVTKREERFCRKIYT